MSLRQIHDRTRIKHGTKVKGVEGEREGKGEGKIEMEVRTCEGYANWVCAMYVEPYVVCRDTRNVSRISRAPYSPKHGNLLRSFSEKC